MVVHFGVKESRNYGESDRRYTTLTPRMSHSGSRILHEVVCEIHSSFQITSHCKSWGS